MAGLLDPLDVDQQQLVDLVADAFVRSDAEWPVFDYVEGMLDNEGKDAWEILKTFPTLGRWGYCAVTYLRGGNAKPTPETEIALTIVGMTKTAVLDDTPPIFIALVDYLASRRRLAPLSPRTPRVLTVTSDEFAADWRELRRLDAPEPRLTYQLMEKEPPTYIGGSFSISW